MALRDDMRLEAQHRDDVLGFMNAATGLVWRRATDSQDVQQGIDLVGGNVGGPLTRTAGMRVRRTVQQGAEWPAETFAARSREVTIRCHRDSGAVTEAAKQPEHGVDLNVYALLNQPPDGHVRTAVLYRASALYRCGVLDRMPAIPNGDGTWFKAVPIDSLPAGVVVATFGIDPTDGASRIQRDSFGDWIVLGTGVWSQPRHQLAETIYRLFPRDEGEQFAYDVLRLYWAEVRAA